MKRAIPCLYAGYGRYISRFRSIPFFIDVLKPVERRVLLCLHEVAKTKKVKSAKVVGHAIANYHPHGDFSTYGSLIQLVNNNFAIGSGNWGKRGKDDDSAAAPRYTEVQASKWVEDLAFEYIDYVDWQNFEYEDEPISLPCPLPIGLIGSGIISGIAFHRTVIPRYSLSDLAKRLTWLLENPEKINLKFDEINVKDFTEQNLGPLIKPNYSECNLIELQPNNFYKILIDGTGSILYSPKGEINNKSIIIKGRAPETTFKSLIKASIPDKDKNIKLDIKIQDTSGKGRSTIHITLTPLKRGVDLNNLASEIWTKYLNENIHFINYVSNFDGEIFHLGIDKLLMNNYQFWVNAVIKYRIKKCYLQYDRLFNNYIIQLIRDIYDKCQQNNIVCKKVSDLIQYYHTYYPNQVDVNLEKINDDTNQWEIYNKQITDEEIKRICRESSIQKLIEQSIDFNKIQQEIINSKNELSNSNVDCYNRVKSLI